jgi:hypothetical protein
MTRRFFELAFWGGSIWLPPFRFALAYALGSAVFACCRNRAWASMTHAWVWPFFRLLRRAGQPKQVQPSMTRQTSSPCQNFR